MSAKPHILTVSNPLLSGEWRKVTAACGEELKDARPIFTVVTEFYGQGVAAVFNSLRSCGKCLKKVQESGWRTYSYGIVESDQAEELRREREA